MFGINLLNRGTVVHGGLNEFEVAEASDSLPEDGDVIRIEGRQLGIMAWLMEQMSLANPVFAFAVSKDFLTMSQGGKTFNMVPTREIHSVSVGYNHSKHWLIAALFAIAVSGLNILLAIVNSMDKYGDSGSHLGMAVTAVIAAAVFYYLFQKSKRLEVIATLISDDHSRTTFGVSLKSSFTGGNVDEDQLEASYARMLQVCQQWSKYY